MQDRNGQLLGLLERDELALVLRDLLANLSQRFLGDGRDRF
jgi:hypothetical protein